MRFACSDIPYTNIDRGEETAVSEERTISQLCAFHSFSKQKVKKAKYKYNGAKYKYNAMEETAVTEERTIS